MIATGTVSNEGEIFVGRDAELSELREALASVREGQTLTVLIEGSSGLGKSTLVRHFLKEVRGEALTLHGRCHEREHVPYKGVDAIVDTLAEYLFRLEECSHLTESAAFQMLPRLFPSLRQSTSGERISEVTELAVGVPHEVRSQAFRAFRELVGQVARRKTLVLAIDDVQWADGDTFALLNELLIPPGAPPLLLLCTWRNSETNDEVPPNVFPGEVRHLRLGTLDDAVMRALAIRLAPHKTLSSSQLDVLVRESAGHPMFLQELVRLHGDEGAHEHVRFNAALWSRIQRLPEGARAFLKAVAVAGLPTLVPVIRSATGLRRSAMPEHLATLREAGLIRELPSGKQQEVEPYHDRVREAVAEHLDANEIRDWHERLARALRTHGEADPERLAIHCEGAGNHPRALQLYRQAATRASDAFAFDRAAKLYASCISILGSSNDGRAELERLHGEALFNGGHGAEAAQAFLRAARHQSGRTAVELRGRAANSLLVTGHFQEGTTTLETALREVQIRLPKSRWGVLLLMFWHRFWLRVRGLNVRLRSTEEVASSLLMRADVCRFAARGYALTDSLAGAALQALELRLALKIGEPLRIARAMCSYALSLAVGGRRTLAQADALLQAARKLSGRHADAYTDGLSEVANGYIAFQHEHWEKSRVHFANAEQRFRECNLGVSFEFVTARLMFCRALTQLGRLAELETYLAPILRDAVRRNDLYSLMNTRSTAGVLVALLHDDVRRAEGEIEEVRKLLPAGNFQLQHFYWLVGACTIDLYRGTPELSVQRFEEHERIIRRSVFMRVQSTRVMLTHLRMRAHLALADLRRADSQHHIAAAERLAKALDADGLFVSRAFACLGFGACALLRGDTKDTVRRLREAGVRFQNAGMELHLAVARHVLAGFHRGGEADTRAHKANRYFEAQGIEAPTKFVRLFAPGFGF